MSLAFAIGLICFFINSLFGLRFNDKELAIDIFLIFIVMGIVIGLSTSYFALPFFL